nr:TetR/AcrR family transcriptional regulator [uncultured Cohaesibacter sp.]
MMGRPKEFDSETVLDAATNCFWSDGIVRTSISSLVDAMKIQRSSFYNSFGSREGILATVLDRYLESSPLHDLMKGGAIGEDQQPDLVLVDLIMDFSHFLADKGRGRGCLIFNGLSELNTEDLQSYELFQDQYANLTAGLSRLIERIKKEDTGSSEMGTLSLHHVLTILIGLAHYSKLDPTENRLATIGLDQLSGLSPHFAKLIDSEVRSRSRSEGLLMHA